MLARGSAVWAGRLALAVVMLTVVAAGAGAAAGARVAAESAPPGEVVVAPQSAPAGESQLAPEPPTAARAAPQAHSVTGRIVGRRGDFVRVRPSEGPPVSVRVLPRTTIRRGGETVGLEALQRGDRVVVVGHVNERGVLQARVIRARPAPPRPPAEDQPPDPVPQSPT